MKRFLSVLILVCTAQTASAVSLFSDPCVSAPKLSDFILDRLFEPGFNTRAEMAKFEAAVGRFTVQVTGQTIYQYPNTSASLSAQTAMHLADVRMVMAYIEYLRRQDITSGQDLADLEDHQSDEEAAAFEKQTDQALAKFDLEYSQALNGVQLTGAHAQSTEPNAHQKFSADLRNALCRALQQP